jgi:geranylgeranyl pyrophosphate synthase
LNDLSFIRLVQNDLKEVENLLRERTPGQHEAIGAAVDHLVDGGGKRLRPALVILSARLCEANIARAYFAGAAVEMLHTATLVHDDFIDGSTIRRGVETLNAHWSPPATVLTGDYIFARAAYLVAQADNVQLTQRFAETLMTICNGEIRQMFNGRNAQTAKQDYEQRIYAKTASLLGLSSEAGAILANAQTEEKAALRTYGEQIGLAFQIADDVLDFVADEDTLGKPVGSDLRQGLITLPALLFLENEPEGETDHSAIHRALKSTSSDNEVPEDVWRKAIETIAGSPAIEQALVTAREHIDHAQAALDRFPPSPYRQALLELADFAVDRRF